VVGAGAAVGGCGAAAGAHAARTLTSTLSRQTSQPRGRRESRMAAS
jgi:hypothetical protein